MGFGLRPKNPKWHDTNGTACESLGKLGGQNSRKMYAPKSYSWDTKRTATNIYKQHLGMGTERS